MSRRFPSALKEKLIARLTGPNAVSAAQLARETGITQQNLSRWLIEARNRPFGAEGFGVISTWSAEHKARIIMQAGALSGDELTRYLDGEGVRIALFRRWRLALEEAGEESVGMAKHIGRLERELIRKEKALAEVAALLVLRESIETMVQREGEAHEENLEAAFPT